MSEPKTKPKKLVSTDDLPLTDTDRRILAECNRFPSDNIEPVWDGEQIRLRLTHEGRTVIL